MNQRPWLIVVGGFLGAGKTTLILAAARELGKRGLRSAAILNDQSDELVDTQYAESQGIPAGEVTGGCFCCRFSELVRVAAKLREHSPEVIFAEPVGSCTDIQATTILPLRAGYAEDYRIAPFTVLVDPARALNLFDADVEFLFRKQLEEADLICLTKSDLGAIADIQHPHVRQLSAKTGQGIAAWLDELISGTLSSAGKVLDIDYAEYARAEAALAWLNLDVTYTPLIATSPAMVLGPLMDAIDSGLGAAGIQIVHLKATDDSSEGFVKAAICGNGREPAVEGALDASPAARHNLRINLRAIGAPDPVKEIVEAEIRRLPGEIVDQRTSCFSPAPPKPEKRIAEYPA